MTIYTSNTGASQSREVVSSGVMIRNYWHFLSKTDIAEQGSAFAW
jgi:hypothetical protein